MSIWRNILRLPPFRLLTAAPSPVLLYHSVSADPPAEILDGLHNVPPDVFRDQLRWLQAHYQIVSIDEYAATTDREGLAAVTFDDGYRSVFEEAWPIMDELQIPSTVFLNGCSLTGGTFWRDQVRYIMNAGLIDDFEAFAEGIVCPEHLTFYFYTKIPANNSAVVDEQIRSYLSSVGHRTSQQSYCVSSPDELVRHSLMSYGNHTQNHYVLSSLTPEQQETEISVTHDILQSVEGIQRSRVFSIPFGATNDFNDTSIKLIRQAGYRAVVASRFRLNRRARKIANMPVIERFMPDSRPLATQIQELP